MKKVKEGYKMTELGEIPENWEVKSIGEMTHLVTKGTTPMTYGFDFENEGINFIKVENIKQNGRIDKNEILKISEECHEKLSRSKIKENDILISIAGSLGKSAIITKDIIPANTNQALAIIRIIDKLFSIKYVNYQLNSNYFKKYIEKISTVGAQPNLSLKQVNEFQIAIPTIKEQQKIASILSSVDEQLEITDNLIEKTKELKKGLMQRLLTRGIGHSRFKDTEIGKIPEEWEVVNFFDIVNKVIDFRGRTPKKLGMDWGEGSIVALSANNVKMGKIDFSLETYYGSDELYNKWMLGNELSQGDIIMTMEAPLGNIASIPDDRKYILSQRVIALKTKEFIYNRFLKYLLMSNTVQTQLMLLSTGTTAKGINQKNLAKVIVQIPQLEEQQKIALILCSVDEQIDQYESKKQKFQELKKGLMQKLLTGKIRVKV